MMLFFCFSLLFSACYGAYWLLGLLGVQVTHNMTEVRIDTGGQIVSVAYIALQLIACLCLFCYALYLKISLSLSKWQVAEILVQ